MSVTVHMWIARCTSSASCLLHHCSECHHALVCCRTHSSNWYVCELVAEDIDPVMAGRVSPPVIKKHLNSSNLPCDWNWSVNLGSGSLDNKPDSAFMKPYQYEPENWECAQFRICYNNGVSSCTSFSEIAKMMFLHEWNVDVMMGF